MSLFSGAISEERGRRGLPVHLQIQSDMLFIKSDEPDVNQPEVDEVTRKLGRKWGRQIPISAIPEKIRDGLLVTNEMDPEAMLAKAAAEEREWAAEPYHFSEGSEVTDQVENPASGMAHVMGFFIPVTAPNIGEDIQTQFDTRRPRSKPIGFEVINRTKKIRHRK